MNKNEWQQMGEDIRAQVQRAVDSNDFSQLSKNITETVNRAAADIGKNINDAVNDAANNIQKNVMQMGRTDSKQKGSVQKYAPYYRKPNLRPDPKVFNNTPRGSVSGFVWMVLGFGTMGVSCLAAAHGAFAVLAGTEAVTALALPVTTAAAGGVVGGYGTKVARQVERFRRYVDIVKDKMYCSIEDMAGKVGKSKRYVRRDLKRMMRKGMFLQAHMDKEETCFIANDKMYEQYCLTQKQYEENRQLEDKSAKIKQIDDKTAKILQDGKEYIRLIRNCNDEIPGEEMSAKLDRLERLVARIFARVEEEPALADDMQKMLSYYLPTTRKLLEAYRDLDRQDVQGKNIEDTKREIEKTIDTINEACEGFLDELFRDRAWDIQSDISVLNTMLKQDGYIRSDFNTEKKE